MLLLVVAEMLASSDIRDIGVYIVLVLLLNVLFVILVLSMLLVILQIYLF